MGNFRVAVFFATSHDFFAICKVFGVLFPGEGTIYLSQTLNFLRPMFVDTNYEAIFTVKDVMKDKHRAIIETAIKDKTTGKICTTGEATVMNTEKI